MKHAQKVALVPIDEMENVAQSAAISAAPPSNPAGNDPVLSSHVPRDILKERLTELDSKMKAIVQDTSLSIEEKVLRYNSVLEQYLLFADKFYDRELVAPMHLPIIESDSEAVYQAERDDEAMIASLPQSYQKKGEILLRHLQNSGTTWDEKGTLFDKGQEIHGTNIRDLIHYVLRHRRRNTPQPTGIVQFQKLLQASNLPQNLVPWKKVFDRPTQSPTDEPASPILTDDQIVSQHGTGTIKKWIRY